MITSGAVTKRVDRLIAQGYVDRYVSADDARSRRVRLTEAGVALLDDLVPKHVANEHRLLAGFSAEERTVLAGLLESWGRALDA
jgi:DNA-binding MarR family transcriptional regulator